MNARILERSNGKKRPIYPEMLDLLLRLNTRAATGDGFEIARRTRELLEQFERNEDQQIFLLTIFEKLDERTLQEVRIIPQHSTDRAPERAQEESIMIRSSR